MKWKENTLYRFKILEVNYGSKLKKADNGTFYLHEGIALYRIITNPDGFDLDSLVDKGVVTWFLNLPREETRGFNIKLLAIEELKLFDISHIDDSGDGAEIILNYPSVHGESYPVLITYTEGGCTYNIIPIDDLLEELKKVGVLK